MTEAEWQNCDNPQTMLAFSRDRASDRKLRLFAVACCRRIQGLLGWYYVGLEVAERYADSLASDDELFHTHSEFFSHPANSGVTELEAAWYAARPGEADAQGAAASAMEAIEFYREVKGVECGHQAAVLRDILGNPFRLVSIDRAWLSWNRGAIVQLADSIYTDRAFDRLPILADALEEAGCRDAAILEHCRGPGPHVRGCWVVDLLLGKSDSGSV